MSRLIDADETLKDLVKLLQKHIEDAYIQGLFVGTILKQPTAYDVEKGVVELRPLSFRLPKDYCGLDGKDRVVMFDDAIEIVRKGGVE